MESRKLVALTFDDGPSNITEKVLDILEENNIVGTFFLIGDLIKPEKKSTMQRQLNLGCEIANHSLTHSYMDKMSAEEIKSEIQKTTDLIKETVGVEPKFFRPPYILVSNTMYENIDLPFICGIDSRDWDPESTTEDRINNVVGHATDGALFLMHDFENNNKTLEALPTIIKKLKEQGYEFTTASGIFKEKNIDPHVRGKIWSTVFD